MRSVRVSPELRVKCQDAKRIPADFILVQSRGKDDPDRYIRIGYFTQQSDGMFIFEYASEDARHYFSEIIRSDDPVITFLRKHRESKQRRKK